MRWMMESIPVTLPQPDGAHKQRVDFLEPTPTPPKRLCLEGDAPGGTISEAGTVRCTVRTVCLAKLTPAGALRGLFSSVSGPLTVLASTTETVRTCPDPLRKCPPGSAHRAA